MHRLSLLVLCLALASVTAFSDPNEDKEARGDLPKSDQLRYCGTA